MKQYVIGVMILNAGGLFAMEQTTELQGGVDCRALLQTHGVENGLHQNSGTCKGNCIKYYEKCRRCVVRRSELPTFCFAVVITAAVAGIFYLATCSASKCPSF